MWFQQNLVAAQTTHNSLMGLEGVVGDRIVSHDLWSAGSPDLMKRDFYL
jgi:hypothetical protein